MVLRLALPLDVPTGRVGWGILLGIRARFPTLDALGFMIDRDTPVDHRFERGGSGAWIGILAESSVGR